MRHITLGVNFAMAAAPGPGGVHGYFEEHGLQSELYRTAAKVE